MGKPFAKITACERCVFGRGEHALWCVHGFQHWLSAEKRIDKVPIPRRKVIIDPDVLAQ